MLIAEPSIQCSADDSDFVVMRDVGALSLVLFGAGVPLAFVGILWRYRGEMFADQLLRVRNEGETAITNPHIRVRRRFRKLYEDYTPDRRYWRLVLLARKMALATVGILLSGDPALQASTACFIVFLSYVLQVNYRPFVVLDESMPMLDGASEAGRPAPFARRACAVVRKIVAVGVSHNQLESWFLVSSVRTG